MRHRGHQRNPANYTLIVDSENNPLVYRMLPTTSTLMATPPMELMTTMLLLLLNHAGSCHFCFCFLNIFLMFAYFLKFLQYI